MLLRTLNSCPQLAKLVGQLHIFPIVRKVPFDLCDVLAIPKASRAIFRSRQQQVNETELAGMLLALLPGLRQLEFGVFCNVHEGDENSEERKNYYQSETPLYELFGTRGNTRQSELAIASILKNVNEIIFHGTNFHLDWFTLPLERLQLLGETDIIFPGTWPTSDPTLLPGTISTTLKCLRLKIGCWGCKVPVYLHDCWAFIAESLKRLPKLEELHIQLCSGIDEDPLDLRQNSLLGAQVDILLSWFTPVAPKLPSFHLEPREETWTDYLGDLSPVTTLDQLTRVTDFSIPQDLLLGQTYGQPGTVPSPITKVLPPELQTLTIFHPRLTISQWLEELLESKVHVPYLSKTVLQGSKCRGDSYETFESSKYQYPVYAKLREAGCVVKFRKPEGAVLPNY
jgi:hypothetical protein